MGNAYGHSMHKPDGAYSALVSGPDAPAVSLADIKAHVVAEGFTDDDDRLEGYVSAATAMFDAAGNGYLGRALVTQRWSLVSGGFPASGRVVLPVPTVQQVVSVTYYDADNAEQTLTASSYRLTVNGEFAHVDLVSGQSWPATYNRSDAVTILYDAGYGDAASDVPQVIRQAISIVADGFYKERADAESLPAGVRQMVAGFRVSRGYF